VRLCAAAGNGMPAHFVDVQWAANARFCRFLWLDFFSIKIGQKNIKNK
jgi:hypothetical protein